MHICSGGFLLQDTDDIRVRGEIRTAYAEVNDLFPGAVHGIDLPEFSGEVVFADAFESFGGGNHDMMNYFNCPFL